MAERSLKNKVVVITGGSTGIGYEIAEKYLEKGVKVIVVVDIIEKGDEAISGLKQKFGAEKVLYHKADVRNENDRNELYDQLINKYGAVDVLVNNAGVVDEVNWEKCFDINAKAVISWTYKYFDHMRKDKGGKGGTIINLSSLFGYRINEFLPMYTTSKFAVFGFSKSLGHEYNYNMYGVRVVAICPGFTRTSMGTGANANVWTDHTRTADLAEALQKEVYQDVEAVSKAAVEVFENANSGTNWLIVGGQPIVEV